MMPEKPLTIATYAAGASLAAITLVYVFGPTFFIDGEAPGASSSSRKKGVVGLSNTANDCFINSVLQALAGLGDLRIYLIRETHRRELDGPGVYAQLVEDPARRGMPAWKIEGLQKGLVTKGLKNILDALNERPLYRKIISAQPLIVCLESSFKQRISRQQQDAQEFLQVVAERVCDEYHAGHRARQSARNKPMIKSDNHTLDEDVVDRRLSDLAEGATQDTQSTPTIVEPQSEDVNTLPPSTDSQGIVTLEHEDEEGFPLEGGSESQIECLTCGFKPRATRTTFCSVTLSVPQVSSTSLSSCFDGMFKTEYIDDFKCERCRLLHALGVFKQELAKSTSEKFKTKTQDAIDKIQLALDTNPEEQPTDIEMPDGKFAPKRKIAKHVRITKFPKIMAIHLSRSIFDIGSSTMKNSAKVSFQERLPLGGLLNQRVYRLSSVVCHKGNHNSGHYESFRRQSTISPPFSTPNTFNPSGIFSKPSTPIPSQLSTPQIPPLKSEDGTADSSTLSSTPELLSPTSASSTSLPYANGALAVDTASSSNGGTRPPTSNSASTSSNATAKPASTSMLRDTDSNSVRSFARSTKSKLSKSNGTSGHEEPSTLVRGNESARVANDAGKTALSSMSNIVRGKRKRNNKWWRISDDKIKESKTSDVLGMQREVYMLFYELEDEDES